MGLHVTLEVGESIYLGETVVTLIGKGRRYVKLVVEAPASTPIDRAKVRTAKRRIRDVNDS